MLTTLTGDGDIDELLQKCLNTMVEKGHDYTMGNPDRLHNFKTVGAAIDLPPLKVLFTYFFKHYTAFASYVKFGKVESEPIEGRIMDLIVYLLLAHKMIKEQARENAPKQRCKEACSGKCKEEERDE